MMDADKRKNGIGVSPSSARKTTSTRDIDFGFELALAEIERKGEERKITTR